MDLTKINILLESIQCLLTNKMAEVLLEIAQNASIRGMRVDGVDVFSVLDFLKYVCHDHSNVKMMWHRLENQMSAEVVTRSYHLKFKGRGQRNTPCMTILGLQKLLLILGSKATVEGAMMSMQDPKNYTVETGAPVQDILKGMLGPRCDENRDAFHGLAFKIQAMHDSDFVKTGMKVEMWTLKGDRTTWVNATSIFKYIYTGARDNFARTQKRHFENTHILHKLLEVPGVSTRFLFCMISGWY
jgi:hypothetical protein